MKRANEPNVALQLSPVLVRERLSRLVPVLPFGMLSIGIVVRRARRSAVSGYNDIAFGC